MAAAMVAGTAALAGLALDGPLLLLAFCGTLFVYHLDRTPALSPEDRFNHPARWRWRHQHGRVGAVLAAGALLGACWAASHLHLRTMAAGAVLAVPAGAYALPVLSSRGGGARRLKDIGAVKPVAVAAAWAGASVALPVLEAGVSVAAAAPTLILLGGYRFLFVLPNLLLADAADSEGDARAGLHTAGTSWPPARLRHLSAGVLGGAVATGVGALLVLGTPPLLAVDLAGPALLLALVLSGLPARRLSRAADAVMLWPAVTVAAAAGWV